MRSAKVGNLPWKFRQQCSRQQSRRIRRELPERDKLDDVPHIFPVNLQWVRIPVQLLH
jgi:hypothetical protein